MTARESNKTRLSKSILEMKFMKRTKEKVEKQQFQESGEEYFGSLLTNRMKIGSGKFILEPSFVFCQDLRDGRISFRGMNPELERLMELEDEAKRGVKEKQGETEISDEQMAKRYQSSISNTVGKKFKTKFENKKYVRNVVNVEEEDVPLEKKAKFLKPSD